MQTKSNSFHNDQSSKALRISRFVCFVFFISEKQMREIEVVLGFGSNIGARKETIQEAYRLLEEELGRMKSCSSFIETEPWGFESKEKFINSAAVFLTDKSPQETLTICNSIEARLGRERSEMAVGYASRTIDIDILFYSNQVIDEPNLQIPHPLIPQRSFVLLPLVEIIPDFLHPILDCSVRSLAKNSSVINI